MRAAEKRALVRLAGRWEREAAGLRRQQKKMSKEAGWSGDGEGTGDEGWATLHFLDGTISTLTSCAATIRARVAILEARYEKR
jgi:hypothetical protein